MKKISLILLLFSLSFSLIAQEKWDLKKCVDYAKEHNIALRIKKLDAEVRENNAKQAKYSLLPNLNASSGFNRNWGRSENRETGTYTDINSKNVNAAVRSSVSLFEGFLKRNTIKQAKIELQAYLEDIEKLVMIFL